MRASHQAPSLHSVHLLLVVLQQRCAGGCLRKHAHTLRSFRLLGSQADASLLARAAVHPEVLLRVMLLILAIGLGMGNRDKEPSTSLASSVLAAVGVFYLVSTDSSLKLARALVPHMRDIRVGKTFRCWTSIG